MASDAYFDSLGDTLVRENSDKIEFALSQKWGIQVSVSGKSAPPTKSGKASRSTRGKKVE